jgi:cytosine/adenosine deaminase-related metal-dependent hydrolase
MLETMKFAALIHPAVGAGILSSERILEMATIDGARALGLDDEVGSLEAGKKANVMVIGRRGKPHLSPHRGFESSLAMAPTWPTPD